MPTTLAAPHPNAAAGLEPDGTPYLCGMDSIGAQVRLGGVASWGRVAQLARLCTAASACAQRRWVVQPTATLEAQSSKAVESSRFRSHLTCLPICPPPQETAKDFMVAGTATDSLLGICESLWRPDLVRGLFAQA